MNLDEWEGVAGQPPKNVGRTNYESFATFDERQTDNAANYIKQHANGAQPFFMLVALMTAICCGQSLAQSVTPESNTELSKETENPVTRRVAVPLRLRGGFQRWTYGVTKDTYELHQAVLPLRLYEDWALITRTKFPAYSQPPKKHGDRWDLGLATATRRSFCPQSTARASPGASGRFSTIRQRQTRRSG